MNGTRGNDASGEAAGWGASNLSGDMFGQGSVFTGGELSGTVFGRYTIEDRLERRGMGEVYKAKDEHQERSVALKVYTEAQLVPADCRQAFLRRAADLAHISHPRIADLLDSGEEDGVLYCVSEFADGVPIDRYAQRHGLNRNGLVDLLGNVCEGLQAAHQRGYWHGAIKPSNILVDSAGLPKVMDFGLTAIVAEGLAQAGGAATRAYGAPTYLAPEQTLQDAEPADARADVYAMGVLAYYLLASSFPYSLSGSREEVFNRIQTIEPDSMRKHDDEIPRALDTAVLKAISKAPAVRQQSLGALQQELISARSSVRKRTLRNSTLWLLLLLVVAGAATVGVLAWRRHAGAGGQPGGVANGEDGIGGTDGTGEQNVVGRPETPQERLAVLRSAAQSAAQKDSAGFLQVARLERNWEVGFVLNELSRHFYAPRFFLQEAGVSIAFSPDGKMFAAGQNDGDVLLFATATGEVLATLRGHQGTVRSLDYNLDGTLLASGGEDGIVRIWNMARRVEKLELPKHNAAISQVRFSPDGAQLGSASEDGTVRVWSVADGAPAMVLRERSGQVADIEYSLDGRLLLSSSESGRGTVWATKPQADRLVINAHKGPVRALTFSNDSVVVASVGEDGVAAAWSGTTGGELFSYDGGADSKVLAVGLNANGRLMATGDSRGTLKVWSQKTGVEWVSVSAHNQPITQMAFSPDGRLIATISEDRTIRVWSAETGKELIGFEQHGADIDAVQFAPKGRFLASASADDTVRVWSLESEDPVLTLSGNGGRVRTIAFRHDGQRIVSGGEDGLLRIWDLEKTDVVTSLAGHNGPVTSVTWSPNGRLVASVDTFGRIILWDVEQEVPLPVESAIGTTDGCVLSFSPDGRYLGVGCRDGRIEILSSAYPARAQDEKATTGEDG